MLGTSIRQHHKDGKPIAYRTEKLAQFKISHFSQCQLVNVDVFERFSPVHFEY